MDGEKISFYPYNKIFHLKDWPGDLTCFSELSFFHWSLFAADTVTFTILAVEFGVIGQPQQDCLSLCLVHFYIRIDTFFLF